MGGGVAVNDSQFEENQEELPLEEARARKPAPGWCWVSQFLFVTVTDRALKCSATCTVETTDVTSFTLKVRCLSGHFCCSCAAAP